MAKKTTGERKDLKRWRKLQKDARKLLPKKLPALLAYPKEDNGWAPKKPEKFILRSERADYNRAFFSAAGSRLINVGTSAVAAHWADVKHRFGLKSSEPSPDNVVQVLRASIARLAVALFKWSGATMPQAHYLIAQEWTNTNVTVSGKIVQG